MVQSIASLVKSAFGRELKPHDNHKVRRCTSDEHGETQVRINSNKLQLNVGGAVAQRVERWTCDQQVVGSNATWGKAA